VPKNLSFTSIETALDGATRLVFVGRKERLASEAVRALLPEAAAAVWDDMLEDTKPKLRGASATTRVPDETLKKVTACVLPDAFSRHNSPARPDAISSLVSKALGGDRPGVICALDEADHALAAGAAVARVMPLYESKGKSTDDHAEGETEGNDDKGVRVAFLGPDGAEVSDPAIAHVAGGIRRAAKLVDMPCSELNTTAFVQEAYAVAEQVGAEIEVISGHEIEQRGFGGLWGVGKAATHKPALAILSYTPEGATETVAWVGKGIVYDTGGLSIKGKSNMPGMKQDMAGAAGMLGAFEAAVLAGNLKTNLYLLLCLAENAVGPDSTRPDDILYMYSGKTVEVNNTDAEGRLVMADGMAYATRHLSPGVIVNMATLTGAQLVATGRKHAACVCNDDALEDQAIASGKLTGDLVHPLPYCPEFFKKEFKSKVADMKNSVKDRMNASSAAAGQFVANHLADDYLDNGGKWLHLDIAGPSGADERGTGYGVALLYHMFAS